VHSTIIHNLNETKSVSAHYDVLVAQLSLTYKNNTRCYIAILKVTIKRQWHTMKNKIYSCYHRIRTLNQQSCEVLNQ